MQGGLRDRRAAEGPDSGTRREERPVPRTGLTECVLATRSSAEYNPVFPEEPHNAGSQASAGGIISDVGGFFRPIFFA